MKILWIEDEPQKKIHQFSLYVREQCGKALADIDSDKAKIDLLKSLDVEIIADFSFFVGILTTKNWKIKLTDYFSQFNLIFCDVNLSDQHQYDLVALTTNTQVNFQMHYEGEGLFDALLVGKSDAEQKEIIEKFYFFSAYDGLQNVKKRLVQLYNDWKVEKTWSEIHCIENRANNQYNEFKPYSFTNNEFARILQETDNWEEGNNGCFYMDDNNKLHNIHAKRTSENIWEISYHVVDSCKDITIIEGRDFRVEKSPDIISTEKRLLKAITEIPLYKFRKYYHINLFKKEKQRLDRIFIAYDRLVKDSQSINDFDTWKGLFTQLRELFEISRDGIQDIIFPENGNFIECMKAKEYNFWSENQEIPEAKEGNPYPEKEIEKLKQEGKTIPIAWELWINFHRDWTSCKKAKSLNRILFSCPKYIYDTIQWAYSYLLSAYELHPIQAIYERESLGNEVLPSKDHEFKVLVEALLLVLDFISTINEDDSLINKMRQYIPYFMADSEKRGKKDKQLSLEELFEAIKVSSHSYEEILKFIRS